MKTNNRTQAIGSLACLCRLDFLHNGRREGKKKKHHQPRRVERADENPAVANNENGDSYVEFLELPGNVQEAPIESESASIQRDDREQSIVIPPLDPDVNTNNSEQLPPTLQPPIQFSSPT